MGKKNILELLLLVAILGFTNFTQVHAAELSIASQKMGTNGIFMCQKTAIKVPSYFPYIKDSSLNGYYFVSEKKKCSLDNPKIFFALSEECLGQNVCSVGSFSKQKADGDLIASIEEILSASSTIDLENNITGYYIPSKCYSYCSEAKIVWFNNDSIYIIGSKISKGLENDLRELSQSANSYLSKKE